MLSRASVALLFLSSTAASSILCPSALRAKSASFATQYRDRFATPDTAATTLPERAALAFWGGCQHQANVRALNNFPRLSARLNRLRTLERQWLDARYTLASLAGGGSILQDLRASADADLEAHQARLVRLTTSRAGAATSAAVQTKQKQLAAQVKRQTDALAQQVLADLPSAPAPEDWKREVERLKSAYTGIQAIAGPAVDATSLEIYSFLGEQLQSLAEVVPN